MAKHSERAFDVADVRERNNIAPDEDCPASSVNGYLVVRPC